MADDPEQLRIFGLQENQHVIATIFNPNSSLHRNLEYLEETAEDACSQAREAFGETDPIYLDAELNASLFYLYRTRNYVSANAHLTAARSIVGSSSGTPDTLLAKLLFTLAINERRRTAGESRSSPITDILTETFSDPFGKRAARGDSASAVEIFRAASDAAARSENDVLPYLTWELGPAFSYELHNCGHGDQAIQLLEQEVLANAISVWGKDSAAVRRVISEVRWLKHANLRRSDVFPDLMMRAKRNLEDTFDSEPLALDDPNDTSRVEALFDSVRDSVGAILEAAPEQTAAALEICERQIHALFEELQEDGRYAEIMNWTDSFLGSACQQIDRGGVSERTEGLSLDDRDRAASAKVGEVTSMPLGLLVPSQSYLSRDHLAWDLYYCGPSPQSGGVALSILIPSLDALATLYDVSPSFEKKQKSLEIRRLVLRIAHANCSNSDTVSRMRLKLAQSLFDHARSSWNDVLRHVLAHTDSLDFADSSDSYYGALRSALRASASFWTQAFSRSEAFWSPTDILPGYGQDGMRAAEFFDRAEYPIEWAQLVHSRASALLAHDLDTTIEDDPDADADDDDDADDADDDEDDEDDREEAEAEGDEDEDPEDEGDDESRGLVFAISQLAAADLILDPIHFVEHWVDIQILRARALGRRAQGELLDDPRDLLLRAKAFISHLEPSMLHQRVAVALLSLDAMDPGSLTQPSFDGSQAHDSRHDVQTLMELRQLGASLFERAKFSEAAPFLEKALNLGERLLDGGRSLKSLRLIAHEIGLIAKSLAYCHHRQGKYARALTTLERGKARLLLSSIETEQIASSLATPSKRDTAWNLVLERRQLIARSDSSMAFVEDIDRFVELQSELNQQILLANPPSRSTSIEYLSNIHEGAAIVWPLITKYGSAVYLVRSKVSGELTDSDVVQLPDFTSDTLEGWLKSDDGPAWLDVYEGRNKSRLGRNKFRETLTRISNLSFSCIFDPVCKKLKSSGVVDIIFVPNSGLQLLPLHCASPSMPETSEGLETALLDQFSFRAVPSATILQLLQGRAGGATGKRGFVAGVSKYDDPQWPDLLNAAVEARAVSDLIGAEPVLDDDVTPSLLSREVRGKQYVHIACHGANWATDPEFSAGFYPKAVLILKRGGVSTREILSTWDLEGTQLVCLSACDTGLIDLSRPWDEAEGITNVMFRLGAQKIVASLWSVDDTSTALLMARFYGNLTSAGMRVEEALRQAQNWLRSATAAEIQRQFPHLYREDATGRHPDQSPPFAHPYFWASFVTTG